MYFQDLRSSYGPRFERAIRISEPCFQKLVGIVSGAMPTNGPSVACRVFMGLRYYAGGSYLDVCSLSGVSHTTFFESVWKFTAAVLNAPELQKRMPLWDVDWLRHTAAGFQRRGNSPLNNIFWAIDGIAIRQEQSSLSNVLRPKSYWCRKGFFELNV